MAALAERHGLPAGAAEKLRRLLRLLVDDPLAPTSMRAPATVLDDHLADSLAALELEEVRAARQIADLGSGAGLPGIPLAVALPDAAVALLESAARKCAFLERAVGRCGASNARVVHARAESWGAGLGRLDLVTARALAPLPVVVEYAAPLLKLGGTLVAWRGERDQVAELAAARAADELGLQPRQIVPVKPHPGVRSRHLHLMLKVMKTPERFPRRPGIAAKRPLGFA